MNYEYFKKSTGNNLTIEATSIYEAMLKLSRLVDNANEWKLINR